MPIFGRIERIFINQDQVYLYCKQYITQHLEESLNAYNITEGIIYKSVNTENLCDPKPFSLWGDYSSALDYVCLRHLLV